MSAKIAGLTLLYTLMLTFALVSFAMAAPPPPPPEYIRNASKVLTTQSAGDAATLAPMFAGDVVVSENGKAVAMGNDASVKLLASKIQFKTRRVIGYSMGAPDLLIADTYDIDDWVNSSTTMLADPRMVARSILFQFGTDQLIHTVIISSATGFWAAPRN